MSTTERYERPLNILAYGGLAPELACAEAAPSRLKRRRRTTTLHDHTALPTCMRGWEPPHAP